MRSRRIITGSHPHVNARKFWINLNSFGIYRVDIVSVSSSSGSVVNTSLSDTHVPMWMASGGTNKVSIMLDDGVAGWKFGTSIDGGVNYSITNESEATNSWVSYWRTMYSDLSDSNLIWAYTLGTNRVAGNNLYVSPDRGTTWNVNAGLHVPPVGNIQASNIVAPRHNGSDAFIVTSEQLGVAPFTTNNIFVDIAANDGTVTDSYTFTGTQLSAFVDENYGNTTTNAQPFMGCCQYGDTDNLYLLAFGNMGLYRFTWSTKTLTSLGNINGLDGGSYQKELISTRSGTLLIPASPFGGTPFLYVYRSTDAGANWTQIDLTSQIPTVRSQDTWDYIAIDNSNTLAIPIQGDSGDGWDGYLLFSTDDGATWQQTNIFIPMNFYGNPIDICGEGI